MKRILLLTLIAWSVSGLSAQPLTGEPEFIRLQREAVAAARADVMLVYEGSAKNCWQKFAVNVCLRSARDARRASLEPLRQQDLTLNAQERLWRTEQRDLRLQGKQIESRSEP